jgi:hypothetical protein
LYKNTRNKYVIKNAINVKIPVKILSIEGEFEGVGEGEVEGEDRKHRGLGLGAGEDDGEGVLGYSGGIGCSVGKERTTHSSRSVALYVKQCGAWGSTLAGSH